MATEARRAAETTSKLVGARSRAAAREPEPEAPAARREMRQREFRQFAAEGGRHGRTAVPQLGGDGGEVTAPGRGSDEFQRGFLERPGHEEAVDDLDGPQALQHRPAGGQGPDPQAGRGDLGQRADVDDDAVGVVGGQRGR